MDGIALPTPCKTLEGSGRYEQQNNIIPRAMYKKRYDGLQALICISHQLPCPHHTWVLNPLPISILAPMDLDGYIVKVKAKIYGERRIAQRYSGEIDRLQAAEFGAQRTRERLIRRLQVSTGDLLARWLISERLTRHSLGRPSLLVLVASRGDLACLGWTGGALLEGDRAAVVEGFEGEVFGGGAGVVDRDGGCSLEQFLSDRVDDVVGSGMGPDAERGGRVLLVADAEGLEVEVLAGVWDGRLIV